MLFSILIPSYNIEKYIDRCLASILCQNEKDYEIIILDDCSKDNTFKKCKEYELKNPKIKVYKNNNNLGQLLTRRKLIDLSTGDYIFFVDGDDYIDKNALPEIKKIVNKCNPDIILFNLECKKLDGSNETFNLNLIENNLYTDKKNIYNQILENHNINSLCTKIIKRTIIDEDTDYNKWSFVNIGEDLFQTLPLLDNAKSIFYYNKVLYYYIKNNSSMTFTLPDNILLQRKILWEREDYYFKKWNFTKKQTEKNNIKRFKLLIEYGFSFYCKATDKSNSLALKKYFDEIINDIYFVELISQLNLKKMNIRYKIYYFFIKMRLSKYICYLYNIKKIIY